MAENKYTVYSVRTCAEFLKIAEALFEKDGYVAFSWKCGPTSSMPQKALIHIWFKKWVAFMFKKPEDMVTENEINAMKRSVKARYYHATGAAFMVEELVDPLAPSKKRTEYTSIADWSPGECYAVMEWMQIEAAERGLILESIGEHKKLKTSTTA